MRSGVLLAGVLLAVALPPHRAWCRDPDALWKIVHGRCVPDMQANHTPAPCVGVDPAGSAVLKDIKGASQYLLIPTARITGIEAPEILAPGVPNYFARAWSVTSLVDERVHRRLPREDFALAINSMDGRSQNQLHIHVDCIRPDIHLALDQALPGIGTHWQTLPMPLASHRYRAIWLPGAELGDTDPFQVLARSLADPAHEMGRHTLVLVGADRQGTPGFILLDGQADATTGIIGSALGLAPGSGEELEDHACRIAAAP
ncbi:CDP-diacylglycerol diphosphatase [Lichenicola sp.]|uniref:CDP-diacylglycerol diphosphatase n=1 Tax=Lichenicola sp. TaxID=2804529 RepID=UPI003B00C2C0